MKCGWYGALFAALLIVLFGGSFASAASDYDNAYQTTDELRIKSTTHNIDIDFTYNWAVLFNGTKYPADPERDNNLDMNRAMWRWGNDAMTPQQISNIQASWDQALETGRWSVSQYVLNEGDILGAYVCWSEDDALSLVWSTTTVSVANVDHCLNIHQNTGTAGDTRFEIRRQNTSITQTVSADPNIVGRDVKNLLVYTDHPNYPPGYEGKLIRDSWTITLPETIRPDFAYTVIDKDITAKDHNKELPEFVPDEGYTFIGYEVEWSLFDDESNLVDYQIMLQNDEYKFTVDDYGTYKLGARYMVQQCYRYPSYPDTPDHCFYVNLNVEFDDIEFISTTVLLDIDGRSFSSNTVLMDCDVSGQCSLPAKTPAALFFNGLDNMNTHGLTAFFTAPITFLGTLPAMAENCSPISFPLLGSTVNIECLKPRYYDWSTSIMNIYTTLLIAGTGYLIAFNVFRNIKDINTPDKDKIEVARL